MANKYNCDMCGKAASVHITKIIDGNKIVVHLCDSCAQKSSMHISAEFPQEIIPQIQDIEAKFFEQAAPLSASTKSFLCQQCGATLQDIEKLGRCRCPACYEAFPEKAREMVRQMQGGNFKSVGKFPSSFARGPEAMSVLGELQQELEKAVLQERYEDAALIRDKLKVLNKPQ